MVCVKSTFFPSSAAQHTAPERPRGTKTRTAGIPYPIGNAMDLAVLHEQRRGHAFHNVRIGGSNNRVHLGDHIPGNHDAPRQSAVDFARGLLFLTEPQDDRAGLLITKAGIVDGTCEWILEHPKFLLWSTLADDDESALPGLWISGAPGKGKTMLAIYVSQILERDYAALTDRKLLHYFCAHNDDKRNTPATILRSWARQLLHEEPDLVQHVLSDLQGPAAQTHTLTNLDTLWRVFLTLVAKSSKEALFCVLDGLDECEMQLDHFLTQVQAYFQSGVPGVRRKLRLMVFSRETQTCTFNEQGGFDRINLDSDADPHVKHSIRLFIESRVVPVALDSSNSWEEVMMTLMSFVMGPTAQTFIWIGYVANELQNCQSRAQVEEVLTGVPRGLDGIYERMVGQVYQADLERCRRTKADLEEVTATTKQLLQWIALVRRPLTLLEVAVILKIAPGDDERAQETVRDRIRNYGHLFQVNNGKVELLHKSAGDFLTRGAPFSQEQHEQYRVRTQVAHKAITDFCLELLQTNLTQHPSLGIEEVGTSSILNSVPLLTYAILYWPEHRRQAEAAARTASRSNNGVLGSSPIITQEKLRSRWWKCYWDTTPNNRHLPTSFSLLHLAAYFGLQELAEYELSTKKQTYIFSHPINRQDSHGRTPLSWAAERGHLKIVQLLINKNADMEICEVGGGRALNRSFHSGCPDVIRLLIHSGAETDYRFKFPFPPARTQEERRELDTPEQNLLRLLDGTGVRAVCLRNVYRLMFLAVLLFLVVVTVLFSIAATVLLQYSLILMGVMLALATSFIVGLLATEQVVYYVSGASLDSVLGAWSKFRWITPLSWSMFTCSSEITDLLLKHMRQPEFSLSDGQTLLSQAAQAANIGLVTQILDRGVQVDEKESDYILQKLRGPLAKHIMERCWDRLTHPNNSQRWQNIRQERWRKKAIGSSLARALGNGCTALARAADGIGASRVEVMALLTERGADPNVRDLWGQTPLFYAAVKGKEDAARFLLSQGNVDVNVLSDLQQTPLSAAVFWGQLEFVKFLVDQGADVMHSIPAITTALAEAAAMGNLELVSYLVEKGVPINTNTPNDAPEEDTPLLSAAGCGRPGVVAFLLQNGAAADVKTKWGESAVILAAARGHEECVDVLLTHGAAPASKKLLFVVCVLACVARFQWQRVKLLLRRRPRSPSP